LGRFKALCLPTNLRWGCLVLRVLTRQTVGDIARFCTLEPLALSALQAHGFDGESFPGGLAQPQQLATQLQTALQSITSSNGNDHNHEGQGQQEESARKRRRIDEADESDTARAGPNVTAFVIPSIVPATPPRLGELRKLCREMVRFLTRISIFCPVVDCPLAARVCS
jgi:hypothetical protein